MIQKCHRNAWFLDQAFEVRCGRVWVTAQPCGTLQPQHPPCHRLATTVLARVLSRMCGLEVSMQGLCTPGVRWIQLLDGPHYPPPSWGSGSIPWVSTVNVALPENGFLLLISSRQVIAFSTAWLFGEKCHLSALHGGDLLEMLPAGARLRLSCRRHLVGKGENRPKVEEGGCRNSVSLWENCLIQHKAALGHGSSAEPVVWVLAAEFTARK